MKTTVNFTAFVDAFRSHWREGQFTDAGLRVLFDHLENEEAMSGTEGELDVVELCSTYTEYSIEEAIDYYGLGVGELGLADELEELRDGWVEIKMAEIEGEPMTEEERECCRAQYEDEVKWVKFQDLFSEEAAMVKEALIKYFTGKAQVINVPHGETFIIANY